MQSDFATYPVYLLQSCIMAGLMAFPRSSQKLSSNGGECKFLSRFTLCLSFHSVAVKLPFTLVFRSPLFIFIFCPEFFGIHFLFGLTVPQQFIVLVCKLSNDAGDEKKLPMYNVCPTCPFAAASPVTVACVAVMERVTCFLSLSKYTVVL